MKRTGNHFDGSSVDDSNQFMEQAFTKSRLSNNLNVDKNEIIRKLEAKNDKLKIQVDKVNTVLGYEMGTNSKRYGMKIPDLNKKVADKELQNAYKQIRVYEYEIKKKEKMDKQGTYIEQIKRIENILKEKQELSEKLKKEIAEVNKQSLEFVRLLKDDNLKNQYEGKANKLHTEIKYLREKITEAEHKLATSTSNRQKQRNFIEKLEKQLIKEGMSMDNLQNLKSRILGRGQYNPKDTTYNPPSQNDDFPIEDRTPQAYQGHLNEIKLLRKVERDHQNKIKQLQKEREEAAQKNFQSRNQLLQVEHSIDQLSAHINELKGKIDPRNMVPVRALSMPKPAPKFDHLNKSLNKGKSAFNHLFKHQETGHNTKLGKRFTDRTAIGKKQAHIVGISFFQKEEGDYELLGFQASYLVQGSLKKGHMNFLDRKKMPNPKSFRLESGDHYKTIEIVTGGVQNNIVGITLVSWKGEVAKGGNFVGNRSTMKISPNEYPCCLYGSLLGTGLEMIGCQLTQE